MRIAFRAEGSASIGMGHLVRCSALAREYMRQGHDACFFCRKESTQWLEKNGMQSLAITGDAVQDETSAFIQSACAWGADLAVLDSYELTQECYKRIYAHMDTIAIDDDVRLSYTAKYILNPNLYAPELDYSGCNVEKHLLGGQYAMLREEFQSAKPIEIHPRVQRILVTMGGTDINNYTPKVLRALRELSGIELLVVKGSLNPNMEQVHQAAAVCRAKVSIFCDPPSMAKVMANCDMAISSAGSTVYELCALGVPSILIQQADNQRYIADFFRRTQAMRVLGTYDKISEIDIRAAVLALMQDEKHRRKMHEETLNMVSAYGVEHIVSQIAERRI